MTNHIILCLTTQCNSMFRQPDMVMRIARQVRFLHVSKYKGCPSSCILTTTSPSQPPEQFPSSHSTHRTLFPPNTLPCSNYLTMGIVAVAGGTGGLGRALVEAIAARGKHEVKILSRKVSDNHTTTDYHRLISPVQEHLGQRTQRSNHRCRLQQHRRLGKGLGGQQRRYRHIGPWHVANRGCTPRIELGSRS